MWDRAASSGIEAASKRGTENRKLKTENRKRRALALTPTLALLYVDFATCPIALA